MSLSFENLRLWPNGDLADLEKIHPLFSWPTCLRSPREPLECMYLESLDF